MLDVSIPSFHTLSAASKRAFTDPGSYITITEKIDGVKITLIRNREPHSPRYWENWIVAYKGQVITRDELQGVMEHVSYEEVSASSHGMAQYGIVHALLHNVSASRLEAIEPGTELLCEFVMRKPTLTRDYPKKHDLFLVGVAPCDFWLWQNGSRVTTFPGQIETSGPTYQAAARALGLSEMPVLYIGPGDARKLSLDGMVSSLGGLPEGIVVTSSDGSRCKLVQSDQHSASHRRSRKESLRDTEEAERRYWERVDTVAARAAEELWKRCKAGVVSWGQALAWLSSHVYGEKSRLVEHDKKVSVNYNDDLMLSTKLCLQRFSDLGEKGRVALVPMSGKPVHRGHWLLIHFAAAKYENVHVVVSSGDREELSGRDAVAIWEKYLRKQLPPNVTVSYSESPIRECKRIFSWLKKRKRGAVVCGDQDDALARLTSVAGSLDGRSFFQDDVNCFAMPRSFTDNISATHMRGWLRAGNKEEFCDNLPPVPEREEIWNLLAHT